MVRIREIIPLNGPDRFYPEKAIVKTCGMSMDFSRIRSGNLDPDEDMQVQVTFQAIFCSESPWENRYMVWPMVTLW